MDRAIITTICPDCKRLSRMICFHIPWYGWDNTCLRCGRNWQDGQWMPLEFSRFARRDNIKNAKKKWKEIKMDTRTGELINQETYKKLSEVDRKYYKQVDTEKLTPKQIKRRKIGRNELCPCGSGKKFKKCCLRTTELGFCDLEKAIEQVELEGDLEQVSLVSTSDYYENKRKCFKDELLGTYCYFVGQIDAITNIITSKEISAESGVDRFIQARRTLKNALDYIRKEFREIKDDK